MVGPYGRPIAKGGLAMIRYRGRRIQTTVTVRQRQDGFELVGYSDNEFEILERDELDRNWNKRSPH